MAEKKIEHAINYYLSLVNTRKKELFEYFLYKGYQCTALNTLEKKERYNAFNAKMYLGMLITLIDDLADNPKCLNPKLLKIIYYNKRVGNNLLDSEFELLKLKEFLHKNMYYYMSKLFNYSELISVFNFDLNMIYLSNNFFELVSDKKNIRNIYEIKLYGHYNMGILAAGMIDLMGIKNINYEELGKCREIFIIAQRISKIANIIATFSREKDEGDITNEIMFLSNVNKINLYTNKLEKEFLNGINKIKKSKNKIKNFNALEYANSIEEFFNLHMSLIGVI